MPRLDGTGPAGMGPMTGRGLGPCGGRMQNRFGQMRRRSAFCPARFAVGFSKEEQKKILDAELKDLEAEKQSIEERIKILN